MNHVDKNVRTTPMSDELLTEVATQNGEVAEEFFNKGELQQAAIAYLAARIAAELLAARTLLRKLGYELESVIVPNEKGDG